MSQPLPYELIALDLDLTLLDAHHQISPRNLAAVHAVRDLGARVCITSGRMYCTTEQYAEAMGLDTPTISYNGAYIKREHTGEVLLHQCLAPEIARELVDFCAREHLTLNYYINDTLYVAEVTPWAELYHRRTGAPLHAVGDLRRFDGQAPTKVLIVDDPARILRLRAHLEPQYADRAYMTISNAEYLEFMPFGVDKGKALAVVARYYGIAREQTLAFGDADNDVPMIAWAGLGVAVENARPAARAAAARIAPRHDEDGVAVVLEELFGV